MPCALSLTVRAPLRVPEAVGVKVTLIVQLELAANGGRTIVGLRIVAGDLNITDVQRRIPSVGKGHSLRRTGGAHQLARKTQAAGVQ